MNMYPQIIKTNYRVCFRHLTPRGCDSWGGGTATPNKNFIKTKQPHVCHGGAWSYDAWQLSL